MTVPYPYLVTVSPSYPVPFGYVAHVSPGRPWSSVWRPTAGWALRAGERHARRQARRAARSLR